MPHSRRVSGDGGAGRRRVDLPPDAIVIRFRPSAPDAVLKQAEKEYRRTADADGENGVYGLSVWADVAREGESHADVCRRLVAASELGGINPENNKRFWTCVRAETLVGEGFTFYKDEDDEEEPPEHYGLDLGNAPGLPDVERCLAAFEPLEGTLR